MAMPLPARGSWPPRCWPSSRSHRHHPLVLIIRSPCAGHGGLMPAHVDTGVYQSLAWHFRPPRCRRDSALRRDARRGLVVYGRCGATAWRAIRRRSSDHAGALGHRSASAAGPRDRNAGNAEGGAALKTPEAAASASATPNASSTTSAAGIARIALVVRDHACRDGVRFLREPYRKMLFPPPSGVEPPGEGRTWAPDAILRSRCDGRGDVL